MKTCPNCHSQVEDDALFCMICGTKFELDTQTATGDTKFCISCGAKIPADARFCPECSAKQEEQEKESAPGIYDDVDIREIKLQCGYAYQSTQGVAGAITINPYGVIFESNAKGVTAFLTTLATLGQKTRMAIHFKDITHMAIMDKGYILYVSTSDGATHCFSGPSAFAFSENKSRVKQIGHIIELYRRMYWYYGGYTDEPHLPIYKPVGYYTDALFRFDTLTDKELMQYFKSIKL